MENLNKLTKEELIIMVNKLERRLQIICSEKDKLVELINKDLELVEKFYEEDEDIECCKFEIINYIDTACNLNDDECFDWTTYQEKKEMINNSNK